MAVTLACVAAAVSPVAVVATGETRQIAWIPPPTLHYFSYALGDISGAAGQGAWQWKYLVAGLVICWAILAWAIVTSTPGSQEVLGWATCLAWSVLPPLLLVLGSFVHPIFVDHYLLPCLPGVALVEAAAGWRAWSALTARGEAPASDLVTKVPVAATPVGSHRRRPRGASIALSVALVGAGGCGSALLATKAVDLLQQRYIVDDYRSAAAALSSDLAQHPGSVLIIPNWAAVGFAYYAAPPELARALADQASEALDHGEIDWQEVAFGSAPDSPVPGSSVLHWPVGAHREARRIRCPVRWVIGRGATPLTRFSIDGSSCRLSTVHYYGLVWVASAAG
jgi:hypothetical protein